MQVSLSIFKMYDIRGLVDTEITEELAIELGRAFGSMLIRENSGKQMGSLKNDEMRSAGNHKTLKRSRATVKDFVVEAQADRVFQRSPISVVVGMDMRPTSPVYLKGLCLGLQSVGVAIKNIGLVSTPAFYFGVSHLGADGGVMVSASHNPAAYNGFKLTRARAIPVSGDSGIKDLARMIQEQNYEAECPGSYEEVNGIPELSARAEFLFAGLNPIKKMKIVADSSNGMGAQYLDCLFSMIEADVTRMFWELDGTFPNHEADPFKKENLVALQKKVLELQADVGICTDGDGDRIFFVDNKGEIVEPAIVRGLLAQIMLRRYPGAVICYDIRPGKITEDMILSAGGKPSVTRVGHSLIKEQMRREDVVFGGESSGHFFYAFPTGTYEGPVTVATQILQEMTRLNTSLAEIVKPLKKYVHSGEINFRVMDVKAAIQKIKNVFSDGTLLELDGISITYPTFWFNIRGSNTEPVLRLNLEAVDQTTMEQKRDEISGLLNEKNVTLSS